MQVRASPDLLPFVLEQDTLSSALSTGSTQKDLYRHAWEIVDWDIQNRSKKQISRRGRWGGGGGGGAKDSFQHI